MKQTGYLIENLLDKSKYFTSTSSYDRPQWVSKDKASVYETADIAERAMKKMIKYGVNSIRLVNLAELAPPLRPQSALPSENNSAMGELPPEDEMGELPPEDEMGELPPEDEMVASSQEEVCPECGHEPCTCEQGHDQGDEIDIDSLPPEDEMGELPPEDEMGELPPEENEEITNRSTGLSRGHTVSYRGQEYVVVGDVSNGVVQIANPTNPKQTARVHTAELLPVHESAEKEPCLVDDPDTKVSVPADVKSGLAAVSKKFSEEADQYNGRDDARASFAMTVAAAADEIKELLDKGTIASLKQAQVRLSSMMNPITSNFPTEVLKFITSGGRKQTLKDLFDSKRK